MRGMRGMRSVRGMRGVDTADSASMGMPNAKKKSARKETNSPLSVSGARAMLKDDPIDTRPNIADGAPTDDSIDSLPLTCPNGAPGSPVESKRPDCVFGVFGTSTVRPNCVLGVFCTSIALSAPAPSAGSCDAGWPPDSGMKRGKSNINDAPTESDD
jgi:hypothetical protein